MSTTLKVIIGLALTLPLVAYVSGSLITPSSFETDRRQPVIMQPVDDTAAPETPPDGRDPRSDAPSGRGDDQGRAGDDEDDQDNSDSDGDDRVDDNGIQVVTPEPTGVDDDGDDDADDDDSRDDDDDDGDDDGDDD